MSLTRVIGFERIAEVPLCECLLQRCAVYRKSIDELYQMLSLMEGPQAAADRGRLSILGPKDKYLALTKARYDNILPPEVLSRSGLTNEREWCPCGRIGGVECAVIQDGQ